MNRPKDEPPRDTVAEPTIRQKLTETGWGQDGGPPAIVAEVSGDGTQHRFTDTFSIGRAEECDLRVDSEEVSRVHAEVFWAEGRWRVRDLGSTNGTYLEGLQVEVATLGGRNVLRLGAKGTVVWLVVEGASDEDGAEHSVSEYIRRYVEGEGEEPTAGHTRMIRKAVATVSSRQRRRHLMQLAAVSGVLVVALLMVWQFRAAQLRRSQATARDIFYSMKRLELRLAELEGQLEPGVELQEGRSQLDRLSSSYDRYLAELGVLDESTPERKRLVLQMARLFGECEAAMPQSMVAEVDRYIVSWQTGTRLADALERAARGGYATQIAAAFDRQHLPPQYFYVALQESDFRLDACGPKTRYGVAKGPWQFIPGTATAYGLKLGPLYLQRRPDPQDERHELDLASEAAARYIRDLYLREAEGSGLLVLAMYNYGGSNVRRLIRSLPEGPAQRNFWRLLIDHREEFPRETYDYVMRIFSAAVIGENPSLFGFDFAPPLAAVG